MPGVLQTLGYIGNAGQQAQDHRQQMQLRAQALAAGQAQLDAQKRALAAQAAAFSGIGGAPPAGQGGGMPTQAPLPGATPIPQGAMPGGGPPISAAPPQGGGMPMRPPAASPQPGPGMGAPPAMGGGQGAGQGPQLSGVAQPSGDPMMDAMNTVKSVAADIKARNPGIDPLTLAEATQQMLGQMKGLEPEMRALAQAQTNLAVAQIRAQTSRQNNQETNDARRDVAGTNAGARVESAKITGKSRTDAAGISAGARVTAAQLQAQSSQARTEALRDVGEDRIDAERYGSDMAYHRAVDAAIAGTTGKPPAAPQGGQRPTRPQQAAPNRGRPSAPPATGGYRSLSDLQAAYKAGKVSADQAKRIARQNGWAE